MSRYFSALPFALPAFVVAVVITAFFTKRLGAKLKERPIIVFLWLASLMLILSATLTPTGHALEMDEGLLTTRVWTWALPSPSALFSINWQSMNLVLFTPIGIASGVFTQWRNITSLTLSAYIVSVLVEMIQYLVMPLGRAQFNSATVIIGWVGITVGVAIGLLVRASMKRTITIPTVY